MKRGSVGITRVCSFSSFNLFSKVMTNDAFYEGAGTAPKKYPWNLSTGTAAALCEEINRIWLGQLLSTDCSSMKWIRASILSMPFVKTTLLQKVQWGIEISRQPATLGCELQAIFGGELQPKRLVTIHRYFQPDQTISVPLTFVSHNEVMVTMTTINLNPEWC